MDNQYNYYKPEENETEQNSYQNPYQNIYEQQGEPKPKKPKKSFFKKVIAVVGLAILFGIVSAICFQGTSALLSHFIPDHVEIEQKISSTELTESTGSVITSDVSKIVDHTIPSIVSITNMSIQQVQNLFGGVSEHESESAGSGIIISQNDSELLIVTNNHVVEGSSSLTVTFVNEESATAKIKGTDAARDLAVVAVSLDDISKDTMKEIKVATLGDSGKLNVGEPAIAIGNALGYGQSVTAGIVSATNRTMNGFEGSYIQTDAAINPGNSGGALLNANGEVIGINSAKIASSSVEGMGFAIPISDASDIIKNLMNRETRSKVPEEERGLLGIKGYDVTKEVNQMYHMPTGVYIAEVVKGSGAEQAGLSENMIVTGFEGTTIDSMSTLQEQLSYYRAGETVKIKVQIPGENGTYKEKEVTVKLMKKS